MKLNSTTLILLLVALGLGGFVYFTEVRNPPSEELSEADGAAQLFDFEESQVQAFTLTTPLRTLEFEKDAAGVWQMREPDAVIANDASIAYLLNLMATGTSDRTLSAPASDWQTFGLHQPFAVVEVTLDDQATHTLRLGEYDFNRSFIYGVKDSPDNAPEGLTELEILLVSPDFENAVSRPLNEWKQPPEEAAPESPESSSPTDSPTSTSDEDSSEAESSPESSAESSSEAAPPESSPEELSNFSTGSAAASPDPEATPAE